MLDPELPVLVTGAGGFVAAALVERLLARGLRVRGTVRAPGKGDAPLRALPGAAERLEIVAADLLDEGAFDEAARGCSVVFHTASPYAINVADPQRDLVDPAVKGTENVLRAAAAAGVRRVVLTSSMAAITDEPPDRVLTEADWNTSSSLDRNPYYFSKVMAERAAWRFTEERAPSFRLVVIHPFLVVGPSIPPSVNTSNRILVDLLAGNYPGLLDLAWGFVDVRDVAIAHERAAEVDGASGRYLCVGEAATMRQTVEKLRALGYSDGFRLPRLGLDGAWATALVRMGAAFQPKGTGSYLRTHLGRVPRYDTTKIRDELGVTFRPLAETLRDAVEDLLRHGHVRRAA